MQQQNENEIIDVENDAREKKSSSKTAENLHGQDEGEEIFSVVGQG